VMAVDIGHCGHFPVGAVMAVDIDHCGHFPVGAVNVSWHWVSSGSGL
jgi:hypothetical protein